MINAQIVPATAAHIAEILPLVRAADLQEFSATNGWSARRVLECGLKTSTFCCAGLVNGKVVTIFGVAPASMIGGSGIPWLVGTDSLEKYQRTFLRRCRKVVNAMLSVYPYLENYVDARNHVAKAWLHWLGFTLEDPAPYGVQGLPFHRFHMEKK
ncbi:TPA: hypothetical protein QFV80_003319 [Klebsiella aerogenes]|uniref:hypothetical protein n=1 Tax=Klebsiella aerogenes TaxID=548 RepID=UPI0002AAF209|nr:hypothetical protein [Klebsiella aerogenes]ELA2016664.1 hypothetical protein [Klebsiella aerogenes]CCG34026.1 hypothetical protein [Klebsiella aerogenes EA1509E]HBT2455131.1 hypothetical protein [Klebsiella aerogenes]HBT2459599.1 hypothetical protein [Klebsiella aerogenes]HBT2536348.1 hypothetical protein [Klebsiella aerogenes]